MEKISGTKVAEQDIKTWADEAERAEHDRVSRSEAIRKVIRNYIA